MSTRRAKPAKSSHNLPRARVKSRQTDGRSLDGQARWRRSPAMAKQTPPINSEPPAAGVMISPMAFAAALSALWSRSADNSISSAILYSKPISSPGGNSRVAQTGDPIVQPGLIDIALHPGGQRTRRGDVKRIRPGQQRRLLGRAGIPGMVNPAALFLNWNYLSRRPPTPGLIRLWCVARRIGILTRSRRPSLNFRRSASYDNESRHALLHRPSPARS